MISKQYALVQVNCLTFHEGDRIDSSELDDVLGDFMEYTEECEPTSGSDYDAVATENFTVFGFKAVGEAIRGGENVFDMELREGEISCIFNDDDYLRMLEIARDMKCPDPVFLILCEFQYDMYEDNYNGGTECDMELTWKRVSMDDIVKAIC